MNKVKNLFAVYGILVFSIAAFGIEYYISSLGNHHCCILSIALKLVVLAMVTWLVLIYKKKNKSLNVVRSFMNAHHQQARSFMGLYVIVFVFIQLHIIGTLGHEVFASSEHHKPLCLDLLTLIEYIGILFLPFLLHGLFLEEERTVYDSERKVLVCGISYSSANDLALFARDSFDYQKIFRNQMFKGNNYNLYSIIETLNKCSNINEVIILLDKNMQTQIKKASKLLQWGDSVESYFREMFKLAPNSKRNIKVEVIDEDTNFNDLSNVYRRIKPILEKKLRAYQSHEIAFNITPGTALVTAATSLFSLKGNRGLYYLTQIPKDKLDEDINQYRATTTNTLSLGTIEKFDITLSDLKEEIKEFFGGEH
jgi:hypothetical protein